MTDLGNRQENRLTLSLGWRQAHYQEAYIGVSITPSHLAEGFVELSVSSKDDSIDFAVSISREEALGISKYLKHMVKAADALIDPETALARAAVED